MPARRMTTAELRDALLAAGYVYDPRTRKATPLGGGVPVNRRAIQGIIGRPLPTPLRSAEERDLFAAFQRAQVRRGIRLDASESRRLPEWNRALRDLRELGRLRDTRGHDLTADQAKRFRAALQTVYGHRTRQWQFYITSFSSTATDTHHGRAAA